jgi:hypothetical protein
MMPTAARLIIVKIWRTGLGGKPITTAAITATMAIVITQMIFRTTDARAGVSGDLLKLFFNVLFSHLTPTSPKTIIANAIMTGRPCSAISGIPCWSLSSSTSGLIFILLNLKNLTNSPC